MNPRPVYALAVGAFAIIGLAACGGSNTTTGSPQTTAVSPAAPATTAAKAGTATTKANPTTTAPASTGPGRGMPGGATSGPAPTKADLAYATVSPSQKLDLWLPNGSTGPTPLVVNIHGGAFKGGDKGMETGNVQALLDKGYAVASLNYRLSGEAPFPAAVQDVKAAVRWLRANAATYNLDPDRFAAWGGSAGGNLAAMLGVTGADPSTLDDPSLGNSGISSSVQAVVDWFGPSDFLTMDSQKGSTTCTNPDSHDGADSPESLYVGAAIQTVPDRSKAASPVSYVAGASKLPPFVIAHGDSDCQVPTGQSTELADALRAKGADVSLTIVPGAAHADPQIASTQTTPAIAKLDQVFGRA